MDAAEASVHAVERAPSSSVTVGLAGEAHAECVVGQRLLELLDALVHADVEHDQH